MARNYSEVEIHVLAEGLIGKTFGEINNYTVKSQEYSKGSFGHIIESDTFDYDINSFSEPDFLNAGIELKVTPYKRNKNNTLSAKERLVLNIINYMDEYKNEFYSSHFWYKNKKIEIVWYLYEDVKKKDDLTITHQLLYSFPEEDLKIIKEAGFKNLTLQKEKPIVIPTDILKQYLNEEEITAYNANKTNIYSITVYGEKEIACCAPNCC